MLSELRHMNDDVVDKQKDGDRSIKDSELFKKQYAAMILQLNEVNEQARVIYAGYKFYLFICHVPLSLTLWSVSTYFLCRFPLHFCV